MISKKKQTKKKLLMFFIFINIFVFIFHSHAGEGLDPFYTNSTQNQYVLYTDENDRQRYRCNCGREYGTLGSIRFHLSAECGKQDFHCKNCSFKTRRKSNYHKHLKSGKCTKIFIGYHYN